MDLRWLSAVEQFRLLAAGEVSAEVLRDAGIRACEVLDPALGFCASQMFDRAPPGVPMLLKDAGQEVAGTPHSVGVAALRDSGHRSSVTTALAARFEEIGFSIVGKAACPALASGVTTEPDGFVPARNPWDRSLSVGGSSGGSAAAVAVGAVAVAHGSDGTGSLRFPAALCGVATLNPSSGRIPSLPPAGQPASDVWRDFVLARHAADLSFVFERLAVARGFEHRRLRVGLLDHDPEFGLRVDRECVTAVGVTGGLLAALGHVVERAWPPALADFFGRAFGAFGVVSDATRPPVIEWVSRRLGRPVARGELPDEVFDAAKRAMQRAPVEIAAARATIAEACNDVRSWWAEFDLLITPATFKVSWPLGGNPGPREVGTLAAPFSLSGQPSLSLPIHRTGTGLPVGVQVIGRVGEDERLLAVAAALEEAVDWARHRPGDAHMTR